MTKTDEDRARERVQFDLARAAAASRILNPQSNHFLKAAIVVCKEMCSIRDYEQRRLVARTINVSFAACVGSVVTDRNQQMALRDCIPMLTALLVSNPAILLEGILETFPGLVEKDQRPDRAN